MNKLDSIRQKIEANREQDAQRAADLENLKQKIADLENQINTAIKDGQAGAAEKMIAEQAELKGKISILERIGRPSTNLDVYYPEVFEANTEHVAELQTKTDKILTEIKKAHRTYIEKLVGLVRILDDSARFRLECASLSGVTADIFNSKWMAFTNVEYDQNLYVEAVNAEGEDLKIMQEIEPGIMEMLRRIFAYG